MHGKQRASTDVDDECACACLADCGSMCGAPPMRARDRRPFGTTTRRWIRRSGATEARALPALMTRTSSRCAGFRKAASAP
eukprot:366348-Chlamydomonas_euryale.AAC.3